METMTPAQVDNAAGECKQVVSRYGRTVTVL